MKNLKLIDLNRSYKGGNMKKFKQILILNYTQLYICER